jgi:hypothetical protein
VLPVVHCRDAGVPDLDWKRWVPLDGPSWPPRGEKREEHSGSCHLQSGCHGQNKEVVRQLLDLVVGPLDLAVIELDKLAGRSMWWWRSSLMVVSEADLPGLRPTLPTSSPASSLFRLEIWWEGGGLSSGGGASGAWDRGFLTDGRTVFLTYQNDFFTYHGFLTITSSSRIISRDKHNWIYKHICAYF